MPASNTSQIFRAEPGIAYAVYVLGGNAAELLVKLRAGKYLAEWIDTKTGKISGAEQFEHTGGIKNLPAPQYKEDIALRLRAPASGLEKVVILDYNACVKDQKHDFSVLKADPWLPWQQRL